MHKLLKVMLCADLLFDDPRLLQRHRGITVIFQLQNLIKVGMFERIPRRQSFAGRELQHSHKQVELLIAGIKQDIGQGHLLQIIEIAENLISLHGIKHIDLILLGHANHRQYPLQLIQSTLPRKQRLLQHKLSHHTSHSPHIHSIVVLLGREDNLGRAVPPGCDVLRHDGLGLRLAQAYEAAA